MSSMRNAVQRRQHRERGQLEGREKWGLLEKHKVGQTLCMIQRLEMLRVRGPSSQNEGY